MVELFIFSDADYVKADLFESTTFNLNKQFTDTQDISKIIVDYTKTVELPRSANNDLIFNASFNPARLQSGIDTSKRIDCRLVSNGNVLLDGYCILNSVDDKKYDITIYGQVGALFKKFFEIPNESIVQPVTMNAEMVARSFSSGPLQYDPSKVNTVTFDNEFAIPQIVVNIIDRVVIDGINLDLTNHSVRSAGSPKETANLSIYRENDIVRYRPFINTSGGAVNYLATINEPTINRIEFNSSKTGTTYTHKIKINQLAEMSVKSEAQYQDLTPASLILPPGTYKRIVIESLMYGYRYEFLPYFDGEFKLREASTGLTISANSGEIDPDATLQVIGFCSTHQGQYTEFDSTRVLGGRTLPMEPYNDRYNGLTEHTIKEFRSYYQQPYIYLRPLFLRLRDYVNSSSNFGGYKLQYDPNWFNDNNPYWSRLVRMGRSFDEREDYHKDGPENPFVFNPTFLGANKGCILTVDDDKKLGFKKPPADFQIVGPDTTIMKMPDTKLLKGNIAPVWTCNLKESRSNVSHNRNKSTLHFAVSITNQIDLQWWGGIERLSSNIGFHQGDVFIDFANCFVVFIQTGSHTESYGFYTPMNEAVPEMLRYDQKQFFDQNGVSKTYPLYANNESYYDQDQNRITFLWDLGIGDVGFVSTTNTDFTYTIKMNGTLKNLRPTGYALDNGFGQKIDRLLYECTDFAGITLGSFPIEGYESENGFEGNVFYSDYDSRRSNSTIGLTDVLAEDDTIMSLLIEYAKMFRLYFDVDYINRTITLRDNLFDNYTTEDWTHKIDYSSMRIKPIIQHDESLMFGYVDSDIKYNTQYKLKTGVCYGDGILKTDIDTHKTTNKLLEGLHLSCISQEYYPNWGANTYRNVLSKEACPVAIDNGTNPTEAKRVSVYGSYFFINEPQPTNRFFDFASASYPSDTYIVSDDSYDEIANNEYCWAFKGVQVVKNRFPYVDFVTPENDRNFGCVWMDPVKKYSDKVYENPIFISDLWQNFLYEIYNKNNKMVTVDVLLTEKDYNQFKFNKLIVINDILYLVNKIKDFCGEGLTTVELLQIYDPTDLMSQFGYIAANGQIRNPEHVLLEKQ